MNQDKPPRSGMKQPESEQKVYTADMGSPPQDVDGASVTPEPKKPKPDPRDREAQMSRGRRYAKGGSVSASRRADGVAQRGKTKGRFV